MLSIEGKDAETRVYNVASSLTPFSRPDASKFATILGPNINAKLDRLIAFLPRQLTTAVLDVRANVSAAANVQLSFVSFFFLRDRIVIKKASRSARVTLLRSTVSTTFCECIRLGKKLLEMNYSILARCVTFF